MGSVRKAKANRTHCNSHRGPDVNRKILSLPLWSCGREEKETMKGCLASPMLLNDSLASTS